MQVSKMHGAEGVNRKNGIDEIGTTEVVKLSVIIDTAAVKQKNLIQFIAKLGFVTTEQSIMEIQRRRYFLPESNTWNVTKGPAFPRITWDPPLNVNITVEFSKYIKNSARHII